jgi:hypothetical protein
MFGQDPHAVYEMIERLHGSLCCYRELRAKYRGRDHRAAPPATASASPTVSPPAAPAPSTRRRRSPRLRPRSRRR